MALPFRETPAESVAELQASLVRDRYIKVFALFGVIIWLAVRGDAAHPYLPILMFALLFDIMAINRERRVMATLLHRGTGSTGEDDPERDEL